MKLIFVDIDGPLATDGCSDVKIKTKWHNYLYKMNPVCVRILNEILEETGANMILSSDWKNHFTLEEIGEIFEWNEIIKKPIAFTVTESVSMSDLEKNRIHQITKTLKEYEPEKWVAFDDLFMQKGLTNFVLVDPLEGLAGDGVKNKILSFLN
jgi:hypothetical protein